MKIEVITTKKKLTKSIINQMPVAVEKLLQYDDFKCLGFVLNCRKHSYKAFLVEIASKYYIVHSDWQASIDQEKAYRTIDKWSQLHTFKSEQDRDKFIKTLRNMNCTAGQIYI